jgi:hypothetical protein
LIDHRDALCGHERPRPTSRSIRDPVSTAPLTSSGVSVIGGTAPVGTFQTSCPPPLQSLPQVPATNSRQQDQLCSEAERIEPDIHAPGSTGTSAAAERPRPRISQNCTNLRKFQVWLEKRFRTEIVWWPLTTPQRTIFCPPGFHEVLWRCVSGPFDDNLY